jgi:hypothetical protein
LDVEICTRALNTQRPSLQSIQWLKEYEVGLLETFLMLQKIQLISY